MKAKEKHDLLIKQVENYDLFIKGEMPNNNYIQLEIDTLLEGEINRFIKNNQIIKYIADSISIQIEYLWTMLVFDQTESKMYFYLDNKDKIIYSCDEFLDKAVIRRQFVSILRELTAIAKSYATIRYLLNKLVFLKQAILERLESYNVRFGDGLEYLERCEEIMVLTFNFINRVRADITYRN
jgi:trehalose/maltose hydrolase-like predicted phosphorylase